MEGQESVCVWVGAGGRAAGEAFGPNWHQRVKRPRPAKLSMNVTLSTDP